MWKITAKGIKKPYGIVTVTVTEDMKPTFEGVSELYLEGIRDELEAELDVIYPMGGTYYPERDSGLNVYNVLDLYFFDRRMEITVEGDVGEIPYEDGVVY